MNEERQVNAIIRLELVGAKENMEKASQEGAAALLQAQESVAQQQQLIEQLRKREHGLTAVDDLRVCVRACVCVCVRLCVYVSVCVCKYWV